MHSARSFSSRAAIAAVCLTLACGGGGDGGTTAPPTPASISLTPAKADTLNLSATYQLSAMVYDQNNRALAGDQVTYESSDPSIATVSSTGLVTGIAYGTTTVFASFNGLQSNSVTIAVYSQALVNVPQAVTLAQAIPTTLLVGTSTPVKVRVTNVYGDPIPGTTVTFTLTAGNGSVAPASALTDVNGIAMTTWTLGTTLALGDGLLATAGTATRQINYTPLGGAPVSVAMAYPFVGIASGATGKDSLTATDAYGNVFTPASAVLFAQNSSVVALGSANDGSFTAQAAGQTYIYGFAGSSIDSTLVAVFANNGVLVSAPAPRFDLKADTTFTTTVQLTAGSATPAIGSLTAKVTWDPTVLSYVSDTPGDAVNGSVTVNTTNVANGSLTLAVASGNAIGSPFALRHITFTASPVVGRSGTLGVTVSDITTSNFTSLLPLTQVVSFPVRTR